MTREKSLADATPPPPTVPQINDAYWFGYSKTLVDGALKSRDDAADKLQSYVGWLWTIYTAGAIVGINLGKLSLDLWPALLIASPVVALVAVYWMTIWVRTPALTKFDPRMPQDIERAYNHNLKKKQRRLVLTLIAAALSAVQVAAVLVYASTVSTPPTAPSLQTVIHVQEGQKVLFVTGTVGDAKSVTLTLYEYSNKARGRPIWSAAVASDKGAFSSAPIILNASTPAQLVVEPFGVSSTGDLTTTLSKVVNVAACVASICNQ
jgi:hypothetical protein